MAIIRISSAILEPFLSLVPNGGGGPDRWLALRRRLWDALCEALAAAFFACLQEFITAKHIKALALIV